MATFRFKGLLQNGTWLMPAYIRLDEDGNLITISTEKEANYTYESVDGYAIPGIPNAHSHAFQYAMVGLTEQHDTTISDDFWTWRKSMYQLALSINPDQMEAIASMLYLEMLKHGYTEVVEFHYIHHQENGQPYSNKAELGERLIAAAKKVGIKITLVPIFYQKGGFGQAALPEQRRFLSNDTAAYLQLWEASQYACSHYKGATLGQGIHSMRAVEPTIIKSFINQINPKYPFHIHVSEQLKEVEASLHYLGKRPVEWFLENVDLNSNFHLVHATHLTKEEAIGLAKSEANVVLCPSTEGNLGDGLFSLSTFQEAGGHWSIGTDSHIGINPFEELRLLDYGQRLISHKRNIFTNLTQGNSGLFALQQMILTGRKAMGKHSDDFFQIGQAFDALILDGSVPILENCSPENLCSTIVYASNSSMHLGTIVNGQWLVEKGAHTKEDSIKQHFSSTLKQLKNR